jgi:copper chaperone NosL
MRKHPAYWLITLAVTLSMIAGGCKSSDELLPEVVVDRSECAKCRMLISDGRFAGLIKTSEYLMFDDLGCMLKYEQQVSPQEIRGMWVRDYFLNIWILENEAIFYRINDISTPMEYGYVAATRNNTEPTIAFNAAARFDDSKTLRGDFKNRFLSEAQ